MTTLNKKQMYEFLDERDLRYLYHSDDTKMAENLKEEGIIQGVIYEPTISNHTFEGVNNMTHFKTLYILR